ncbi:DUF6730 family protein [Winogradskyella wichelsiae]|uniref:DUF6730 family protein n=1 Tax=Winogradskyella wichelsiae TaxID=2697007 RepID=UPI003EF8D7D6
MKKLEEQIALMVDEINDFRNGVEQLEKINDQLKATKIKMDLTDYKTTIEIHKQQMTSCLKSIKSFENRFENTIMQAKIYPNWAVVMFVVSVIGNVVLVLYLFM